MLRNAILAVMLLPAPALAAWEEWDWNPTPQDDDIILPMPCDGAMAFRRIDTPATPNWLADTPLQMGNSDISGQEHSESPLSASIAGGLTQGGPAERYYLLGKYEVSQRQYQAVMSDTCPGSSDAASLPAEGMSWLDAQNFTARYTAWLYENARDVLRDAAGDEAFLRLPTEEEWEFAARGGLAVTEAVRRARLFPMDGPIENYVWFAGFKSCGNELQPIGVLKPNPLGLHDIIGNVQELTAEPYRLRTQDRMHGQAGGASARGGSCLTGEARVRTAERDEIAPFDSKTGLPKGKPMTGLRLAVGSTIMTSAEQINALNHDWMEAGQMRLPLEPGQDPVEALGVIAEAEGNQQIRDALLDARELFQREMSRRNEIEGRSASAVAQSGLLGVRDYILALDELARINMPDDASAEEKALAAAYIARIEERRQIAENFLLGAIVHAVADFDQTTFDNGWQLVADENAARFAGMSEQTQFTSARMLEIFREFVVAYRARPDTEPEIFLNQLEEMRKEFVRRFAPR